MQLYFIRMLLFCVCNQVHRDSGGGGGGGGGSDEVVVEVTGDESARQTAQELIDDIISSQDYRGYSYQQLLCQKAVCSHDYEKVEMHCSLCSAVLVCPDTREKSKLCKNNISYLEQTAYLLHVIAITT